MLPPLGEGFFTFADLARSMSLFLVPDPVKLTIKFTKLINGFWGFSEPLTFIHSDFDPKSEGCRPNTIYPLNSLIFFFHGNGLVYIAARHKIFQI